MTNPSSRSPRAAHLRPGHPMAVARTVGRWVVAVQACVARFVAPLARRRLHREVAGQATAEYALVLLGAAAVALMLTAWAARSGAIGDLFDAIVDQLIAKAA